MLLVLVLVLMLVLISMSMGLCIVCKGEVEACRRGGDREACLLLAVVRDEDAMIGGGDSSVALVMVASEDPASLLWRDEVVSTAFI